MAESDNQELTVSNDKLPQTTKSELTEIVRTYAFDEQETHPHEAFREFANSFAPDDTELGVNIGWIQKAADIYNQVAPKKRKVTLYYHFTDTKGAADISKSGTLGKEGDEKIFLTKVTPQAAKPLLSAKEALEHMDYWGRGKASTSFKERSREFALQLKVMWRYRIVRHLDKSIVTVGGHKLENAVILAARADKEEELMKIDKNGEYYVDKPIAKEDDPNVSLFGPFPVPN